MMIIAARGSASKWIGLRTMAILVTMVTVMFGQKPVIESVKFFDKYNSEVSLAYEGGRVEIGVEVHRAVCTSSIEMVYEKVTEVASAKCENGIATHRLDFKKSTKFGNYSFRHNNESNDPQNDFKYVYRTCGKDDTASQCDQENAFCIVSEGKVEPCIVKIGQRLCNDQHKARNKYVCTGWARHDSLCHAIADGRYSSAVVEQNDACATDPNGDVSNLPRVKYTGKEVKQNEPIHVTAGKFAVEVHCPSSSDAYGAEVTVTLARSDGTDLPIPDNHTSSCNYVYPVNLPTGIFDRSDIHKFDVVIKKPTANYEGHLMAYLITTGGKVNCTKHDSGSITRAINCSFIPPLPPAFTADWTVTPEGAKHEGPTMSMQPSETGTHTVKATVKFQSTNPYKQPIKGETVTDTVDVVAVAVTVPATPSKANVTEAETLICVGSICMEWSTFIAIVASGSVFIAVSVFIVVTVVCCVKSRKRKQAELKRQEAIEKQGQQMQRQIQQMQRAMKTYAQPQKGRALSSVATMIKQSLDGISDVGDLKDREREMANAASGGSKAQFDYVRQKLATEVEDIERHVKRERLGDAPTEPKDVVMKKAPRTIVTEDLHGDRVFIQQVPAMEEMYDWYKMLQRGKVGVLVVVGPMDPRKPLWPMKQDGVLTFPERNDPRARRSAKPTMLAVSRNDDGSVSYKVLLEFVGDVRFMNIGPARQEILIIHMPWLPSLSDPRSLSMYCEVVDLFVQRHVAQIGSGYPGMAVLCPDGVQYSPALVAMIFSYELYLHERKTSLIGCEAYVRSRCGDGRWMSKLPPLKLFAHHWFKLRVMLKLMGWHTQAETGRSAGSMASVRGQSMMSKVGGRSQVGTSMVRSAVSQVGGRSRAGTSMVRSQASQNRKGTSPMRRARSADQNRGGPSTGRW